MYNLEATESNLDQMKNVHQSILQYIDNDANEEENYRNVIFHFENNNFISDADNIKQILYLLAQLSDSHFRKPNFFSKIEHLIIFLKKSILQFLNREEIFSVFRKNKRVLLFLFEEKLLILDLQMIKLFCEKEYTRYQYISYFSPEIKPLIPIDKKKKGRSLNNSTNQPLISYTCLQILIKGLITDLPENFYEKRKIGENDTELCKLIREDSLDLFIAYVRQNEIPLNSIISPSIYETHRKIGNLDKKIDIIRYALFFGSIQIVNFLQQNYFDELFDLFNFAVFSSKVETIKQVEKSHQRPNTNIESVFREAIKCHHSDVAFYIRYNYLGEQLDLSLEDPENNIFAYSIRYRNFIFFPNNLLSPFLFFNFCKYNYYNLCVFYLANTKIDLNMLYILKI